MTRIQLTPRQAQRLGLTPTMPSVESRDSTMPAKRGTRVDSHPMLSGAVVEAVVGKHRHRFKWCAAWECWISLCGLGRHHKPQVGEGQKCVRCYQEEADKA